jgi:hypothetical protein
MVLEDNVNQQPVASDDRRFRSIVVGAGFSALAGMPLGDELWKEVLRESDRLYGKDSRLRSDANRFCKFKGAVSGLRITLRLQMLPSFVVCPNAERSMREETQEHQEQLARFFSLESSLL